MLLTSTVSQFSNNDLLVCLLGVGIVFLGLIGIVLLCKLSGVFFGRIEEKHKKSEPLPKETSVVQANQNDEIPNREELVAAVSAALAEYMGENVNSFRIVSIKRI